ELHRLYPLDLLEAKLKLVAESQRRAVEFTQSGAVHLIGKDGESVPHMLNSVTVVIETALRAAREGVENDPLRLRVGLNDVEKVGHSDPAPFSDPRPPLDAVVLRNLFALRHRLQFGIADLDRILDFAIKAQLEIRKASL